MSTRANIIIKHGDTTAFLYRHMDGSLAWTGRDLVLRALARVKHGMSAPGLLVGDLLKCHYEPFGDDQEAQPVYELTNGEHGDIEHLYLFDFDRHTGFLSVIEHHERKPWAEQKHDDRMVWTRTIYGAPFVSSEIAGLESFALAINAEINDHNKNLAERKAERPKDARYQAIPPLPLITITAEQSVMLRSAVAA